MENNRPSLMGRSMPFGLTFAVLFIVCISTVLTYTIPGGARWLYYLITGPFNVAVEQNGYSNIVIMLAIIFAAEFYFKATDRPFEVFAAIAGGACTTYAQSIYLLAGGYGFVVTGTSMLGLNVLLFLMIFVALDALARIRRQVIGVPGKRQGGGRALALLFGSAAAIMAEAVMIWLFFLFYITNNQAAPIHEWGIEISVPLTLLILWFRAWAWPRHKPRT